MPRRAQARQTTRASTSRGHQSRNAAMRELMTKEAQGVLWYDATKTPPGMKYGWIAIAVNNQGHTLNIITRQQSGWKPVPADRHPELTLESWGLPTDNKSGRIEVSGLLLCEIPIVTFEAHKELQEMMAFDALKMPHIQDLGDSRVAKELPMFDESETNFERVTTEKAREMFKEGRAHD